MMIRTAAAVLLAFGAPLCAQAPRLLADVTPGVGGTRIGGFWSLGRASMFFATDPSGIGPRRLWRTDATPRGTWQSSPSAGELLQPAGDRFISFHISAPGSGVVDEIRAVDGRVPGSAIIRRFNFCYPALGGALPDRVVFVANGGVHGAEPWVTDGTLAGTRLLADVRPGALGSYPTDFHRVGQTLFFFVLGPMPQQVELWSTDGTPVGTRRVTAAISYPPQLQQRPMMASAGGKLFIGIPPTIVDPFELIVVDGPSGPVRTVLVQLSPNGYDPERLVPFGDSVLFALEDAAGMEPWISDGTTSGTRRLIDLEPGPSGSWPEFLEAGEPALFFATVGGAEGLYATDGTAAGTTRIHANPLGYLYGTFEGPVLEAGSDRFLFLAATAAAPFGDLWETDKTVAGTRLLSPGFLPFALHLGQAIHTRDDPIHGVEPWVRPIGPVATRAGIGCGVGARVPELESNAPRLGGRLELRGRLAPIPSLGFLVLGAIADAPVRLGGGCLSQLDLAAVTVLAGFLPAASTWRWSMPLRASPSLHGITVGLQAWYGPAANPVGFEATNGVHLTLAP